jgi:hypothetical protein
MPMMSPNDPVVVRTASTPSQAKVFVALLQAEGIPAYIEGDSLTDEFAASRRLMNLLGVNVLVPASERERAAEILANVELPAGELEAQALAAAPEIAAAMQAKLAAPPPPPQRPSLFWPVLAVGAIALAVVFFCLWQSERNRHHRTYGRFLEWLMEGGSDGYREK